MNASGDLFADTATEPPPLPAGLTLLRGRADGRLLLALIADLAQQALFRHMVTPGGQRMGAAMTNCGPLGWVTDRAGYRYAPADPDTGMPWPPMPAAFAALARDCAAAAGFHDFAPDACLINRYAVGAGMGAHQDRDEVDFAQPIVSVSLGLPAVFDVIGPKRTGPKAAVLELRHGDVLVMGGPTRRWFHGVRPIKAGTHAETGPYRYNLTFRRAV